MTVNVVSLTGANDQDKDYMDFIDGLRDEAIEAVFVIAKADGTHWVGSTAKTKKDLLWDLYKLTSFMDSIVRNGADDE